MALACDQCRRVPHGTELGEKHPWIRVDLPTGVIINPQSPPEYSGLKHIVSYVTNTVQFCTVGCMASYILAKGREIDQIQADSREVVQQKGVINADHWVNTFDRHGPELPDEGPPHEA